MPPTQQLTTRKQRATATALLRYVELSGTRVGEQLQPLPVIAKDIGVSVNLLQIAAAGLQKEGILRVVPRVGTFVVRLPSTSSSDAVADGYSANMRSGAQSEATTVVRLFAAESGNRARSMWRKILDAFELRHPGTRIRFSMNAEQTGPIAGADVIVTYHGAMHELKGELLDWVDDEVTQGEPLLPPLADAMQHAPARPYWPMMMGTTLLFANKQALKAAGLFQPERWQTPMDVADTCTEYFTEEGDATGMFGWALHDEWAPLLYYGFSRRSLESVRDEVKRYVDHVATCAPPQLVTLADVHDPGFLGPLLQEWRALFVTGYSYHNAPVDHAVWEVLPPPIPAGGVPPLGTTMIGVRANTECPEQSVALARFLAGAEAQAIVCAAGGQLPAVESVARRHALYPIYERQVAHGWLRESLDPAAFRGSRASGILQELLEVRSRAADPEAYLRRLLAYEAGSEFTEGAGAPGVPASKKRSVRRSKSTSRG